MPTTTISLAGKVIYSSVTSIRNTGEDILAPNELNIINSFKLEKRRREWLAGRRAAKEAVLAALSHEGFPDTPDGLEILTKSGGEPYVIINGTTRSDMAISISHSNEVALAAVGRSPIIGVGIDVEVVEDRASSFLRTAFTPSERTIFQLISPDLMAFCSTSLYTMKEAVTKALGIGLSVNTYDVEVLSCEEKNFFITGENSPESREDQWNVVLHKEAKARLAELGGSRIIVSSQGLGDMFERGIGISTSKKYAVGLAVVV